MAVQRRWTMIFIVGAVYILCPPWTMSAERGEGGPSPVPRRVIAFPLAQVDLDKVHAAGIRQLSGKHLTLFTDVPSDPQVDALTRLFGLAYPQWCRYFGVRRADRPDWHIVGCLMRDKKRFQQTGLFPANLPKFLHGYSAGTDLWLYDQPSEYYRRHLLLHEGTHAFMNTILGGSYPPWYTEGLAELLATHHLEAGQLTLGYFPKKREEVPLLGRIKILQDARRAGRLLRLDDVFDFAPRAFLVNESYAWSWATVALLDGNPSYRRRFRSLSRRAEGGDFSRRFEKLFARDRGQLREEWELFVATIEHDHDLTRTAIDFSPGEPLAKPSATLNVAADRGWQNSGLLLEEGTTYQLDASGRYQIDDEPRIWWCEPGGVTIRYYHGRPLGMLLATVRPQERTPDELNAFLHPLSVGLGSRLTPEHTGTLYLRINDSAGELDDNHGTVKVNIRRKR